MPTIAAAVFGWAKYLHARRDKQAAEARESAEREKRHQAEAELLEIKRRAPNSAPFLTPSGARFDHLTLAPPDSEIVDLTAALPNVLSYGRVEVSSNWGDGKPVFFVIENRGAEAVDTLLSLDGAPVPIQDVINKEWDDLIVIEYPYAPEKHGLPQNLTVEFTTSEGFRDTHRYEMIHGHRTLRRVDPK